MFFFFFKFLIAFFLSDIVTGDGITTGLGSDGIGAKITGADCGVAGSDGKSYKLLEIV
jgi:hypothetical protein